MEPASTRWARGKAPLLAGSEKPLVFILACQEAKCSSSWSRMCWAQEEAKAEPSHVPHFPGRRGHGRWHQCQRDGEDGFNVQLGLVATGRARNSSQVTKQPGDNAEQGHQDWGNIPSARCWHPEQEQSITAGTWAGQHCCGEEGDCHQLVALPASPAAAAAQSTAAPPCTGFTELLPFHLGEGQGGTGSASHLWDGWSGAGSSQQEQGAAASGDQGGH